MVNSVNPIETKTTAETVTKPAGATIDGVGGSCPTCRSGLDPTIVKGDFTDALRDAL
jgi:hypothetical protein